MRRRKDGFNKKGLCKLCKEPRTKKGHDPCIADLPGVLYACCGHGMGDGYIKFTDGRSLKFTPVTMDLDRPKHMWVKNPVPMRVRGDRRSYFSFKKGKKKSERVGNLPPVDQNGWKFIRGPG